MAQRAVSILSSALQSAERSDTIFCACELESKFLKGGVYGGLYRGAYRRGL